MLGSFSLRVGLVTVHETDGKPSRLSHLLKLLITFREHPLSIETLSKHLWKEPPANPKAAIANLVYRLRGTLREYGILNASELILVTPEGYQWNNKFSCFVDTEELETLYLELFENQTDQHRQHHSSENVQKLERIITLYQGFFLPTRQFELWTKSFRETYHEYYLTTASYLISYYLSAEDYFKAEVLCKQVVSIDPYAAEIQQALIDILWQQTLLQQAVAHYRYAANFHFQKQENTLPPALTNCYNALLPSVGAEHLPLFKEENPPGRGCYLEYPLFREFYRVEIRTSVRLFKGMFLVAILLQPDTESGELFPASTEAVLEMERAMSILHTTLVQSLQVQDLYAKASETHYILLLHANTVEECEDRVASLLSSFRYRYRGKDVIIRGNIQRSSHY